MKTSSGRSVASLALAAVAVAFWMGNAAATDNDGSRVAPPGSHAYGKTLTEWLTTYLRWGFSGADPAQSMVGHVDMLPIPAGEYVSGAGTPDDPALYRGQLGSHPSPGDSLRASPGNLDGGAVQQWAGR